MAKPIICQIEISYLPKRGQKRAAQEAIADALDRLIEEGLAPIVDGASTTGRYVQEVTANG